jgi:enoyl-CoA hydratase
MNYDNILVEVSGDGPLRTGVITLNRPKQLNALNDALMDDLGAALRAFDADDGIGCIVVTGAPLTLRGPLVRAAGLGQ